MSDDDRQHVFHNQLKGGGVVVVLTTTYDELPREEDGLALMREQVAALRSFTDNLERVVQDWSADLEAGRRRTRD